MEGPRAAKRSELDQVIGLINSVFRTGEGLSPSMEEEFPLLLSQDNIDNVRIMLDNGKPVAAVNYYSNTYLFEGSSLNVASIGAVCTHPDFRRKSLTSILLDDVESKTTREDIDLLLISGDLNIYVRRGCIRAFDFNKSLLLPGGTIDDSFEVVEYDKSLLQIMISLYSKESARFYRNRNEFEGFLKGATTPWGSFAYRTYFIKNGLDISAYVVLRVIKGEKLRGEVIEYAGCRESVFKGLQKIIPMLSLSSLEIYSPIGDNLVTYCKKHDINTEMGTLYHTLKIMNFVSLMNKLRDYFAQYVTSGILNALNFGTEDGKYIFRIGEERLEIADMDMLTRVIFSSRCNTVLEESLSEKPLLTEFFKSVFPVPFPYPGGLNYI